MKLGKAPTPRCEVVKSENSLLMKDYPAHCNARTLKIYSKYFLCAAHCLLADVGQTLEVQVYGYRDIINL
jgi:hypothetical protein